MGCVFGRCEGGRWTLWGEGGAPGTGEFLISSGVGVWMVFTR